MQTVQALPHTHKRGGDMPMGNIVKTYHVGDTTIHICDDCCAKTPEEIERVDEAIQTACWKSVDAMIARGEEV